MSTNNTEDFYKFPLDLKEALEAKEFINPPTHGALPQVTFLMRRGNCTACNAISNGVKSRKKLNHTCGK